MVLFVNMEEDGSEPPQFRDGMLVWQAGAPSLPPFDGGVGCSWANGAAGPAGSGAGMEAREPPVSEVPCVRTSLTEALRCYPIVVAIASSIDLTTLDNLSRTCRRVREALLEYRNILMLSTLRCVNEDLPVDREETLRYRARASNWSYMEDIGRTGYVAKSGCCARDLVAGCRRCGTVICRNCTIKPPAPIVLRERHRRLCVACTRAPLGRLVEPPLREDTTICSELVQRAICRCDVDGVWLCQPCGRSIRADDYEYRGIWKWRHQYGEVLGGVGTGIGEGDRGVPCGRENACVAAREREQETDCDAADAREAEGFLLFSRGGASPNHPGPQQPGAPAAAAAATHFPWGAAGHGSPDGQTHTTTSLGSASASSAGSFTSLHSLASSTLSLVGGNQQEQQQGVVGSAAQQLALADTATSRRTPSPAVLGPGYARHEIEGIGGVVKTKLVQMVRVGACVPEWEDERTSGSILKREVSGQVRSWCGWCCRVIPGKRDCGPDSD